MANTHIMVLVSLLLLPLAFRSAASHIHEEAPRKVLHEKSSVVEGMVYCQSCKALGTGSLSDAEPIPYARVNVTCTNRKNVVFYYKEYTANENGYFFAKLEAYSFGHYLFDHPLKACKVKLVSSPVESCNVPTNVNDGITGASLRHEHKRSTKKDCDYKLYAAGPLAFRPSQCTSDESNY